MRGFDSSSSIYVDGIRDLGSITRDVFNLEQIEVTKGPSGPDYGRTSPTGAINLITKQPFLHNANTASISYGTASQRRITSDLNLIVSPDSAFRLNIMGQDSGVPGRNNVKNKRWGLAPSAAFGLGTSTRVFVNLHIYQPEQHSRRRRAHHWLTRLQHPRQHTDTNQHRTARGQQKLLWDRIRFRTCEIVHDNRAH